MIASASKFHERRAVIDIKSEKLIPLRDVPQLDILPDRRSGSRLAVSSLYRWALQGVRGHRLETLKIGGQRCTSLAALERFFQTLSQPSPAPAAPPPRVDQRRTIGKLLDAERIG